MYPAQYFPQEKPRVSRLLGHRVAYLRCFGCETEVRSHWADNGHAVDSWMVMSTDVQ